MKLYFKSPYPLLECMDRLRAVSEKERFIHWPDAKVHPPLSLREETGRFRLQKSTSYGNTLRPMLCARLHEAQGGTQIYCWFEVHPINSWLLAVWYGALAYILFFIMPLMTSVPSKMWFMIGVTAFMMIAPTLVWVLGTWLSRNEKRFLLDALSQTLKARPASWEDISNEGSGGSRT